MSSSHLFSNRNFHLHWAAIAISSTGSFFTIVALPWLALSLSHDNAFISTSLLACTSLPQGFAILFGGGLADQFSPYRTLWISRSGLAIGLFALAALTYSSLLPLWLLYFFAIVLGSLGAIATPASQALLPVVVPESDLAKANGIVMGTVQLSQFVGPIAAGLLIWFGKKWQGLPPEAADPTSIAFAFLVEAMCILIALVALALMQLRPIRPSPGKIFQLIREGFRFCWRDEGIRVVLGYLVLISFFLQGPLLAALPLFTKFDLGLSERAYGMLYGMIGVGTVVGGGLSAWLRPSARVIGRVVLGSDLVTGVVLYSFSGSREPWVAGACLFGIGTALGVTAVAGITWFQTRTPAEFMGRVMGILMFSIFGLIPISATVTGQLVSKWSVRPVLQAASVMIIACAAGGLASRRIREVGAVVPAREIEAPKSEPLAALSTALAEK